MPTSDEPVRIEVRLRELAQLFNSLDPSPFLDRDLDRDAEEFIVSWARELPKAREFELVVHLATTPPADRAEGAEGAVRHYFDGRAAMVQREFAQLMRRGRMSLVIGLLFLTACLLVSDYIASHGYGTTSEVVRESLTIGGWVAMWRPLEIYLYDWWPLREELRRLRALAQMRVRLILPSS